MADCSGGAVELVLGVEDEKYLEGANNLGMGLEVAVGSVFVHHVQEVLDVAKIWVWSDDGLTDSVAVAGCCDGRSASHSRSRWSVGYDGSARSGVGGKGHHR